MEDRRTAAMKLSTDRILTTHVGSLPRPPDLLAMLEARETGQGFDEAAFEARLARAVREIVEQQVACGIDSVCDGEQSKISYTFYVRHRLSGIGTFHGAEVDKPPQTAQHLDLVDHPDAAARMIQLRGGVSWFAAAAVPCCTGPVAYRDRRPLDTALKNLADACAAAHPGEAFMNAASPGVLTKFVPDTFYKNEDAYVEALAEALQPEYEAIVGAGFVLQIDAPDLGSARHNQYQHLSDSTSNFVEHPRLIAQRICHYADIVGRERVIAGTDCGFATFAGQTNPVVPSVVWAKLKALAEGAAIATDRLL